MKRKNLAGILSVLVLTFILLGSVFVVEHSHHDCHEEDCPICLTIAMYEKAIDSFKSIKTTKPLTPPVVTYQFPSVVVVFVKEYQERLSLIENKIRLNI